MNNAFIADNNGPEACNCVGRQVVDGVYQPACPCAMRHSAKAEVERRLKENPEGIAANIKANNAIFGKINDRH